MNTKITIKRVALFVLGTFLFVNGYAQHSTTFKFSETAPDYVLRNMEKNANALFAEINKKYDLDKSQLDITSTCATKDAQERIVNMWAVSHFYCTRTSMNTRVMKMVSSNSYQVRNIPICYKDGEGDDRYRHIVLEFDLSGKISDLYCVLPDHEITRADGSIVKDFRHKEQINNFINIFFTAYNCKDISLIEKMYSDNALIITGKVVKNSPRTNNDLSKKLSNSTRIYYLVQTKKDYITRLKGVFARNEYINIKFDGVEIIQSEANPKIFGVRLNQYWHVSRNDKVPGYYDEGKLFLIIDFTDEEQPLIWIRAWQPFQDSNGKSIHYSEEDFFSIGDFDFE